MTCMLLEEIKCLAKKEKQTLLQNAGNSISILHGLGLAMRSDLGIPWNKLRIIRRLVQHLRD